MSRGQSYFITLFRTRTRQNHPNTPQIRSLTVESRDGESKSEELQKSAGCGTASAVSYTEMAKTVSTIMRERQRWQQTLVSDFPSFDFADPLFFRELLKSQNNVLLSMWFFRWLCSNYDYTPDPVSLNLLFGALLDANAVKAAKSFLDSTGFNPEPRLLEQYVKCLCEDGLVDEGIQVYNVLKENGTMPSIATSNSVLLGCVKARKFDRFWELHQEMTESEVDLERIQCLIQALCEGGDVSEGYELLRKVLRQGLDPGHAVYAKLISGFCQIGNYACMSEILHTMIAWNHFPSIYTYHEIIKGLCKNEKQQEAFCIFNDLKEKGYAPDIVIYTTMIHGLCEMGWFGSARKLWCEMVNKGMRPNEFTYNVMIHAHLKRGEVVLARELYSEMLKNGFEETTVSCNTMITGFCSYGRADQAFEFFKKMSETGVTPDAITYNALVQGFCKENKVEKGIKLFEELKALGLKPSGRTYAALQKIRYLKMPDSVATSLNEILDVA
ncbi:pentatricopeptide repeat-containing protein At5g18950 isoform X1 [Eutrema salsugineum]|uniref:pentatricopeptide repeat-containing protein At5g18950 isoform X1 n=1 Tax=Eutrema salsugineum TaxID=72664 RepID=UPI000CECF3EC|nr:pentatricopeptide repeat-containing protein At5g18950 isoform X1 [Eutrema salsugineum]